MDLNKVVGVGSQSTVYCLEKYVIKLFNEDYNKTAVFYEALINTIIEHANISIPKVHEIVNIDNKLAIKMDYIDGISLIDCIYNDRDNLITYIKKMVELQIQLHSKVIELPFSFKDKLRNKILETQILDVIKKKRLLESLEELPNGKNLCHGDFHGYNILVCNEDYWIIDWVDASYGCPEGDACRTYMIYSIYAPELAEIYLRIYCEKTNKAKNAITDWLPVIAAARLSENIENEREQLMALIKSII